MNLTWCAEYKDDSQIISRSSSVIVKRLPSTRPGKGKAAMYIAGVGNAAVPTSETVQRPGGNVNSNSTWHKGAMSKRFGVKEDSTTSKAPPVRTQVSIQLLVFSPPSSPTLRHLQSRRTMNRLQWLPCFKLRPRTGRRPKKRCHSWCRALALLLFYVVEQCLMNFV